MPRNPPEFSAAVLKLNPSLAPALNALQGKIPLTPKDQKRMAANESAQERQLQATVESWLTNRGYERHKHHHCCPNDHNYGSSNNYNHHNPGTYYNDDHDHGGTDNHDDNNHCDP